LAQQVPAYSLGLESGLIVVRHTGPLDFDVLKTARRDITRLEEEKGFRRVLVDLSGACPSLSVLDIFKLGASSSDELPQGMAFAVYYRPGQFKPEDAIFAENVYRNRGQRFKVFTDPDDARGWLADT